MFKSNCCLTFNANSLPKKNQLIPTAHCVVAPIDSINPTELQKGIEINQFHTTRWQYAKCTTVKNFSKKN